MPKVNFESTCLKHVQCWRIHLVCVMKVRGDLFPSLDKRVCCVCPVSHRSSSIFTLVELGFTWGQGVFDNTLLSPSYRYLNYNQRGATAESCESAYQAYPCHPSLCRCSESWDSAKLDKHWQLRRGISMTDGYWLGDMVICFCAAAQLISHKETQETLLDYYSERLSVSLHWIPYLIHLSFSLCLSLLRIY